MPELAPTTPSSPSEPAPEVEIIRLADLPQRKDHAVSLKPQGTRLTDMAEALGLLDLRKATLMGRLVPVGRKDWDLLARIGATATQACVTTLAPVKTRIDEDLILKFRADLPDLETAGEIEVPEDDAVEPLPDEIDLWSILLEAVSLALPLYPRAEGSELAQTDFAAPGVTPLRDEDTKPFAGLAHLKRTLGDPSKE